MKVFNFLMGHKVNKIIGIQNELLHSSLLVTNVKKRFALKLFGSVLIGILYNSFFLEMDLVLFNKVVVNRLLYFFIFATKKSK